MYQAGPGGLPGPARGVAGEVGQERVEADQAGADLGAVGVAEQVPADQVPFVVGEQAGRDGLAEGGLHGGGEPAQGQAAPERGAQAGDDAGVDCPLGPAGPARGAGVDGLGDRAGELGRRPDRT